MESIKLSDLSLHQLNKTRTILKNGLNRNDISEKDKAQIYFDLMKVRFAIRCKKPNRSKNTEIALSNIKKLNQL
jgi:hypothetical protein